jgi:hypothetical protein
VQGAVRVDVVDVDGRPLAGVNVCVSGAPDCVATDAAGRAAFPRVPVGIRGLDASDPDFLPAFQTVQVTENVTGQARVAMTPGNRYTTAVLATAGRLRDDPATLDVDVDFVLVDGDGAPVTSLSGADVTLEGFDCGFAYCGAGLGGGFSPLGASTLAPIAAGARQPYAAVMLIDPGTVNRSRTVDAPEFAPGLARFVTSATARDRVIVAAPQAIDGSCALRTVALVASGGAAGTVSLPPGATAGCPIELSDLIAAALPLAASATGSVSPTRRAVIVLTERGYDLDARAADAVVDAAAARGISLWLVSLGGGSGASARTRGGFLDVHQSRGQLRPAFAALDALLSGTLPAFRLTGTYRTGGEPFRPGGEPFRSIEPLIAAKSVTVPTGARLRYQEFAVVVPRRF